MVLLRHENGKSHSRPSVVVISVTTRDGVGARDGNVVGVLVGGGVGDEVTGLSQRLFEFTQLQAFPK